MVIGKYVSRNKAYPWYQLSKHIEFINFTVQGSNLCADNIRNMYQSNKTTDEELLTRSCYSEDN